MHPVPETDRLLHVRLYTLHCRRSLSTPTATYFCASCRQPVDDPYATNSSMKRKSCESST